MLYTLPIRLLGVPLPDPADRFAGSVFEADNNILGLQDYLMSASLRDKNKP